MSEYIEKKIDTYAEFIQAIIQHNIFIDEKDNLVHQWLDEFDDAAINPAWATRISGTGSITEANDKINISRGAVVGDYSDLYSDFYLPLTYDILVKYKINAQGGRQPILFSITQSSSLLNMALVVYSMLPQIVIRYKDTGGVFHYWDFMASNWNLAEMGCPNTDEAYLRFKKTATQYIITLYNNLGVQITQATVAIALVYPNEDIFYAGEWAGLPDAFDLDFYWIAGVVNDKKALGRFTNIIDLGQLPINKGVYSDAIDTTYLYDETVPDYYENAAYSLRISAEYQKISQGFKLTKDGVVDKIRIAANKSGAIIAGKKVWAEIWTDDGTGKPLALVSGYTSIKIEADGLTTVFKGLLFYFNNSRILNKNTQYHLVLDADYVINGADRVNIGFTSTVGLYVKGIPRQWDGTIWKNVGLSATDDMIFGIHLRNSSLITRFIQYADWVVWKTLTSKADFEGYDEVPINIDTVVKPGYVLLEDTGGGVYPFGDPIWTKETLMGVLPSADGWTYTGTAPEATYCSVAGGILTINTIGAGAVMAKYEIATAFNNATGSTAEARIKVIAEEGGIGYRYYIGIYDGTKQEQLFISDDRIRLNQAGIEIVMDTTADYHIYRMTLIGGVVKVYVDGLLVLNGVTAAATGANFLRFGDGEIGAGSNSNVLCDYINYFVGGAYAPPGSIQNDIDLGQVPTDYLTLSAAYKTPESTAITFEIASSNDGITYTALAAVVMTAGKSDLTAFGKHRYWRVKAKLATSNATRTPELDSWTIDAFEPVEELTERTLLKIFRYMKIEINLEANSCCDSGVLTYLEAKYRIAYELYIKRVKYKISSGGIVADLELSNK